MDITGIPHITDAIKEQSGYRILTSTLFPNGNLPWVIQGKIENGMLMINFPEEEMELSEEYGSNWSQGIKVAEIHIEQDKSQYVHIALRKYDKNYDRIYIYYADNDFNKFNGGTVHLKKGWNFVEGTGLHGKEIGLVTQDINDFIKKGYRWQIEMWI